MTKTAEDETKVERLDDLSDELDLIVAAHPDASDYAAAFETWEHKAEFLALSAECTSA